MPCRYYTEEEERAIIFKELNEATDLLCKTCKWLEEKEIEIPEYLQNWWINIRKEIKKEMENKIESIMKLIFELNEKEREEFRELFLEKYCNHCFDKLDKNIECWCIEPIDLEDL